MSNMFFFVLVLFGFTRKTGLKLGRNPTTLQLRYSVSCYFTLDPMTTWGRERERKKYISSRRESPPLSTHTNILDVRVGEGDPGDEFFHRLVACDDVGFWSSTGAPIPTRFSLSLLNRERERPPFPPIHSPTSLCIYTLNDVAQDNTKEREKNARK